MDTPPRRYRLKLTQAELDRFLKALAEIGNLTLAAERVGRHRSTFVKRCTRDPAFAARCGAAVAAFRLSSLSRSDGEGSRSLKASGGGATAGPGPNAPLKCTTGDLVLVHGRRRPAQIRRAGGGELTEAGLHAFLQALAATANIRLAADSVGVWPNAIRQRRHRDPAFDRAVRQALRIGYDRLEAALVESACRAFDPDAGHEEWLDRNGGPDLPKMNVGQALMLLAQHRRTCRQGWDNKRAEVAVATQQEVKDALKRRLREFHAEKAAGS